MNPRIVSVTANDNFTLTIVFTNFQTKVFDVKPYLGKGLFAELNDLTKFKQVKVINGTVCWKTGQDFCPDTLFEESKIYIS